jgi:hypothetical protein
MSDRPSSSRDLFNDEHLEPFRVVVIVRDEHVDHSEVGSSGRCRSPWK